MAIAAACFCGAHAADVTGEMAIAAAEAWMAANPSFGTTGSAVSATAEYDGDAIMWWTVATSSGGAIFVSPETSLEPVLAAAPSCPGSLPAAHPLRAILKADVANRRQVIAASTVVPAVQPSRLMAYAASPSGTITNEAVAAAVAEAESRWTKYTTPRNRLMALAGAPAANVTVLPGFGDEASNKYMRFWDQDDLFGTISPCFNLYTPENAVCGCVATAGAAILQYFGSSGLVQNVIRECTINGKKVALTTISATNRYDWSILPQTMGGQDTRAFSDFSSEEQDAAVSLLGRATYDMGVCVNMGYTTTPEGSGAYTEDIAKALMQDFGFHRAKAVTFSGTNGLEVAAAITNDICHLSRPVALGIRGSGGHAVLGVGYGEDDEGMQYTRLFMGWGGAGDAWYNLPEIKAATGAGYHVFNLVTKAVTSIALNPPLGYHSIEEAKAAALESHKPILLVSGTEGEEATDNLIDYINDPVNGLAARFEIYFADYGTNSHADQNPSYGVFNPLDFNNGVDDRWAFFNGRLAYDTDTNITVVATVLQEGLDKWDVAYASHLHDAAAQADGISVNVIGTPYEYERIVYPGVFGYKVGPFASLEEYYDYFYDGVSGYLVDEAYQNDVLANVYTNGETAVISAPCEFSTNENKVVWKCVGWELYVHTGTKVDSGEGTTATFAVSAGTAYSLCWIWEPDAVKVTVSVTKGSGTVNPDASGGMWLQYGTVNTFVATPVDDGKSQLDSWNGSTGYCLMEGSTMDLYAYSPCSIRAWFKEDPDAKKYKLSISSVDVSTSGTVDIGELPTFGDRALVYGDNTLLEGKMAVSVPDVWTNDTDSTEIWQCVGWTGTGFEPGYGYSSTAGFSLTNDSAITWYWMKVPVVGPLPPAETPVGPVVVGVTNSAIVIYSTNSTQLAVEARVSNAVAGYWYSIGESSSVTGTYSFVSGTYTGTAKKKADDPAPELLSFTIIFDPAEASKFYRVVVTEEEPE